MVKATLLLLTAAAFTGGPPGSTVSGGGGDDATTMKLVVPQKWEYVLPGEAPHALGSGPDGQSLLPIPHQGGNGFVVEALHELYAPDAARTPDYYDIATAAWAGRWPVEDLWAARLEPDR
jgi:hypothetical protein